MSEPRYPNISDILGRKAQGRLDLSRRSFGEKIEAIEALRERLRPFAALRPSRSRDAGAAGTGVLDGVESTGPPSHRMSRPLPK